MTIYQIFTRIFGNRNLTRKEWGTVAENGCGKMNDIDERVLSHIHDMGVTHVWYTGLLRHASMTDYSAFGLPQQHRHVVKGRAGSPYAIADYYDVDPDLAVDVRRRMSELEVLIERTHTAGLKVIVDFVPNHVAREYKSVCRPVGVRDLGQGDDVTHHFDIHNNFYYCWGLPLDLSAVPVPPVDGLSPYEETPAKATGNDHFDNHPTQNDWYETVKLNYGVDYCDAGGRSCHFDPMPDTWRQMTDILLFWAAKGVDGFRCDMAEMVPPEFWSHATATVKSRYNGLIFIGEVYNPDLYRTYLRSGFDYLYDKVGMYDTLRDVLCGRRPASSITQAWQTVDDIRGHMLYFLENHDEQRVASDYFCGDGRKAIPALIVAALLADNPFMLYAGQEFGERGMDKEGFSGRDGRTTIFDYWALETLYHGYFDRDGLTQEQASLESIYQKVLRIARDEPAAAKGLTFDLQYVNQAHDHFDPRRHYAFLRKAADETLMTVVNFSGERSSVRVNIPSHAFDYLHLPEQRVTATDLLTGDGLTVDLRRDGGWPTVLPPYSGKIYKFTVHGRE